MRVNLFFMSSLFCTTLLFLSNLAAQSSCSPSSKPTVINYGYNKFVKNPYSNTIAAVTFDSDEGIERFERSRFKKAFFKLAPHYAPQQDIASCGIASSVIILNTLYAHWKKTPPISKKGSWYVPEDNTLYGLFMWTETNFYNKKVSPLIDKKVVEGDKKVNNVYDLGVSLNKLTRVLQLQGLKATGHHVKSADPADIQKFRKLVKSITADPYDYLIANYNLNVYAAESGGHFSPLVAYDEQSDSILILDTWAASNTWIWVKLEDFYKSMNTLDGHSYRGYILIHTNR